MRDSDDIEDFIFEDDIADEFEDLSDLGDVSDLIAADIRSRIRDMNQ